MPGLRGTVLQRPGNSIIVLSRRTLRLFCLGVLGCELRLTLAELALSRSGDRYLLRRGCVRNFVGGHMIGTSVAVEIILRICPLAGGSVILLCIYTCFGGQYGHILYIYNICFGCQYSHGLVGCGRGSLGYLLRQVCPKVIDVSRWLV